MPIDGYRRYPGDRLHLSAGEVQSIFDTVHTGDGLRTVGPPGSYSGPDMAGTNPDPVWQPGQVQQRIGHHWLGTILNEGPAGEPDYSDARYWVQETLAWADKTPPLDPSPNDLLTFNRIPAIVGPPTQEPYPFRHVTATNLRELYATGSSHSLETDGSVVVSIQQIIDNLGQTRAYFEIGVSSRSEVGIVRLVPRLTSQVVTVQLVRIHKDDGVWNGTYDAVGDLIEVNCYPGTFGRHYQRFICEGDPTAYTTYLPVEYVAGAWHVQQHPKFFVHELQAGARITDCTLPVKGGRR